MHSVANVYSYSEIIHRISNSTAAMHFNRNKNSHTLHIKNTITPRLHSPLTTRSYQTAGLTSTCPDTEVKDRQVILEMICGQYIESSSY